MDSLNVFAVKPISKDHHLYSIRRLSIPLVGGISR